MNSGEPLVATELGRPPLLRGKVRDIYALGEDRLLFVATDRISAFDHILGSGIPDKGSILTQLSLFWFDFLRDLVPNHLISADMDDLPDDLHPFQQQLQGRSMIVHRAEMFPIECVARGYLSGSGWADYRRTGALCGMALPSGLRESDRLPETIFTPAAKNSVGHDENISFDEVVRRIGGPAAEHLRSLTLGLYDRAHRYAADRGLILADTKFEFGVIPGADGSPVIVLADEVLTPDSTRYWIASAYKPGGQQASFDKQFVRDYLEQSGWNKQAPAPSLPADVVDGTRRRYLEAFRVLTGRSSLDLE